LIAHLFGPLSPFARDRTVLYGMSKQQTGLRLDRILFKQFRELCRKEHLRTGEAVESLIRIVVDAGSIIGFSDSVKMKEKGHGIEDILFKSRLSRLECIVELEAKYFRATGKRFDYEMPDEMEMLEKELAEIARRHVSEELLAEFQTILGKRDTLYVEIQAREREDKIKDDEEE